MKFEYEGVFFIGWVIRLVIFQQVSDYKFKVRHLFIIPILTLIMVWTNNYHHLFYKNLD